MIRNCPGWGRWGGLSPDRYLEEPRLGGHVTGDGRALGALSTTRKTLHFRWPQARARIWGSAQASVSRGCHAGCWERAREVGAGARPRADHQRAHGLRQRVARGGLPWGLRRPGPAPVALGPHPAARSHGSPLRNQAFGPATQVAAGSVVLRPLPNTLPGTRRFPGGATGRCRSRRPRVLWTTSGPKGNAARESPGKAPRAKTRRHGLSMTTRSSRGGRAESCAPQTRSPER